MTADIRIFPEAPGLMDYLASQWLDQALQAAAAGRVFTVALCGGRTPQGLFSRLAQPSLRDSIPWKNVHLFWGDERCVPPDHEESNYGMARKSFIDSVALPEGQVHRIRGECDPIEEADRYAGEIRQVTGMGQTGYPVLNWVLLGLGIDGHTASLFPGQPCGKEICTVAFHPATGQKRISLTLPMINQAERVTFFVTRCEKAQIVREILSGTAEQDYPAGKVNPGAGRLEWCLDAEAASLLKQS